MKDRPTHPPVIEAIDLVGMLVYISVSGAGDLRGRAVGGVITEVKAAYSVTMNIFRKKLFSF